MFTANQLSDYCDRHHLSPQARQVIERVRSSPPTRRVRSGARNVASRFASRKMCCVIQAESHKNELPAVIGWEYDKTTHEFYDQPPKIKVAYVGVNGRRCAHMMTPDFFLLQDGFAGWVECKTEEWLRAHAEDKSHFYVRDGNGHWRCPPGEEFAASVGLGFQVRSSAETNWVAVRNASFLADYGDERAPAASAEDVVRVQAMFDRQALMPLKELIEAKHGVSADVIYRMIVDGTLYVDLDVDLLTEPERTCVFRDASASQAYRLHLASQRRPAIPNLAAVKIAPGQSLLWDGKPWRIANVGVDDVFLEDDDRVFTHVPRQVLEQLVRDKKVTGIPQSLVPQRSDAAAAIRGASPSDIVHAVRRYRALFPDKLGGPGATFTNRALRKWRALYRQAETALGSGFVGLLPKLHLRGNRERKLDKRVIEIMDDVIDELYASSTKKTLVSCWGEVILRCEAAHQPPPSEEAFRQQIRRRDAYVMAQAREGEKGAYDLEPFYWCLERTTPRHGERPFEIGHIDHTQLDLQFVGNRRGEPMRKAWLTVLIDACTRMVVAWAILFEPPSYRSCMTVIRDCVRRHGRVPKTIVTDKGSEFESVYYETLLAFLDSHKKTRPGGKPRFGSVVERIFGISNKEFIHNLLGNNQALQKPRRLSKSHDPRRLAVWTLPKFRDAFEGYLDSVYHEAEHSAHGMSPKQAMAIGLAQAGLRPHTLIPYSPDFVVMCMPTTKKGTATIDPTRGVKISYVHYWAPEFRNPLFSRREVPVRYDPDDKSTAFVWLNDRWVLCRSEYAADFEGRTEKEVAAVTQEIQSRLSQTRQRRIINAALIAGHLRETAATEQALAELKQAQGSAPDAGSECQSSPTKPKLPANTIPDQSVWDNLNLKFFGEFK